MKKQAGKEEITLAGPVRFGGDDCAEGDKITVKSSQAKRLRDAGLVKDRKKAQEVPEKHDISEE